MLSPPGRKNPVELFPQIVRKPLEHCEAGELLRLQWGEWEPFALTATGDQAQFLVFLSAVGDAKPPLITHLKRPDLPAVSYGSAYRIDVDQDARYVDLAASRLWRKNGVLLVAEDHYVLRLSALPGSQTFGSQYVRLDTGTVVPEPAGNAAVFGKWSLMLPKGGDRYETLLTIG